MPNSQFEDRLAGLRYTQKQRRDEQARLQLEPHFGAAKSGFMGEQDYLQSLNDDAEIASMEATAAGRQQPRKIVNYGAPGLRAARPGAGSLSLGEDEDPMDKALRQGLATQEYQRGRVGMDEYADQQYDQAARGAMPTGRRALDLGYTADAARKTGDIVRAEGANNQRAAAESFMDPTVASARRLSNQEQEALITARYGREADAQAKIEAARLAAEARTGAARITANGNVQKNATSALVRNRGDRALMGDPADQQSISELDSFLGQQAGMPADQEQTVDDASFSALLAGAAVNSQGADQLARYWDQLTPAQQQLARQQLGGR